jgi:hypothetical protein
MRDHQKIAGFKKQIGQLNAQLQEEIEEASRRTGHSRAEINLALEDRGWLRSTPVPEGYDPTGKIGSVQDQLVRLRKQLKDEEEKK